MRWRKDRGVDTVVIYHIDPSQDSRELKEIKEHVAEEIGELKRKISLVEMLLGQRGGDDLATAIMKDEVG